MKVGILVDGQAEYRSLPLILPKINTNYTILNPLYCDIQPFSPPALIAYVAMKRVGILVEKGASLIILLIDKEKRKDCVPKLSKYIEVEFSTRLSTSFPSIRGKVVIKNKTYENWLVADPTVFIILNGMFDNASTIKKVVIPDKADNLNACELLKRCTKKGHYEKIKCAMAICEKSDPTNTAQNSRSFRRFLRILNNPKYVTQSKNP